MNEGYILAGFVIDAMTLFECKCFKAFCFFLYLFNNEGFKKHSRIVCLITANIRLVCIPSSGKSYGQDGDDENNCSRPEKNSNAVYNKCHHRILFVKTENCFHR